MKGEHVLRIGIATREEIVQRTKDIAAGRYQPRPAEPRVWATSLDSVAKILTIKNMLLLELIRNSKPDSLAELAEISGRTKGNLSRTLKKMEELGVVHLERHKAGGRVVPSVPYKGELKVVTSFRVAA